MKVLGIDPGYDRMGVAILEKKDGKENVLFSDCLISNKQKTFNERLFELGQKTEELIKKYKPEVLVLEKLFINTNQKTATQISEVRGMLLYIGGLYSLEVFEYTPIEIKMTVTGHGQAKKDQVTQMVKIITGIKKEDTKDDEFDAIATGLTYLARCAQYPQK